MATIETKYSVGDRVFCGRTTTHKKMHKCPDCFGEKEWSAVSPAGQTYKFSCPRCQASYYGQSDLRIDYTEFCPRIEELTIGSVRHDTHEKETSYMCKETGVGSGSVYREAELFPTREGALAYAEFLAADANKKTDWVVKQFDQTLQISDYQLAEAGAEVAKNRYQMALANIRWFIEDLEGSTTFDEVQKVLENFRQKRDAA